MHTNDRYVALRCALKAENLFVAGAAGGTYSAPPDDLAGFEGKGKKWEWIEIGR